ncbi:hypothetical protein GCM10022243_38600 [Saccharothrix violaceirubra]|uniref:Putative lipoprotein with Yx(FWY)xxD motif n=1 Tax=Saccharothrix violaceirubra TaxID=413306 RepID=A0A7W7WUI3_9PSEU|nr:hypothetical protein [Saccharothrix violaceirubra]MBB4964355.1 putative lipoprotein with Yx(FWY)xxD motif [Saccharothrix violaceirubra]
MTRFRVVAALAVAALVGACGQQNGAQPVAAQQQPQQEQQLREQQPAEVALTAGTIEGLGTVLTDAQGMTLYRFDKDTAKPSESTCDGDCAAKWPPALAGDGDIQVEGVDRSLVGTVDRQEGKQLTIAGWPLYRFAQDQAPGEAKGQGVGGTWFAAATDGKKAATDDKKAAPNAGLVLTTSSVGDLGTVLTDKDGMTLYRFDKDTAKPAKSNCEGDCAAKWPPLLVQGDFEVRGVDRSLVGTVDRPEGKQLTVAGWPLYTFVDDKVCGDAKGQGVGGTWFVANPQGGKAGA